MLTALRYLTMVFAIGLALYGQLTVHGDRGNAFGWAILGIAAVLAAAAAGQREPDPPASGGIGVGATSAAPRTLLAAFAVAAIAAATYLSSTGRMPPIALLLWLAAPVLGSLAVRGWQVTPPRRAAPDWSRAEVALAAAIVALAALARFLWIETLPRAYFGDEPRVAMYLFNAYRGDAIPNFFSMGWNTWPAIGLSLQGLFASFLGLHMWTLRLSSALMGTLGVLVTYLLARELFTVRAAAFAALLFAVCRTAIDFSRLGITHAQIFCFEPLALFCLWRALNGGAAAAWVWAGVTTAWCLFSYNAGQLVPPLVFLWLLFGALARPSRLTTHWRGAALLAAAFALTIFPYLYYFTDAFTFGPNWGQFTIMARNRQSFGQAMEAWRTTGFDAAWDILSRQAWFTWLGFGVLPGAGYPIGYRHGGMLDEVAAALFVLGLGMTIRRVRHGRDAFPLYWWAATVFAGGIATVDPPSFVRLVGLLPALALLAALPLEWLTRPAHRAYQIIGAVVAIALTAAAAWDNYRTYFVSFASVQADAMSELARYMDTLPPDYDAALLGAEHHLQFRGELFTIEFPGRWRDVAEPAHYLPLHEPLEAPRALILGPTQATLATYLRALYPHVEIGQVPGPGGPFFGTAVLTPDDVRSRIGLTLAVRQADGSEVTVGRRDPFASPLDAPAGATRLTWTGSIYWPSNRPLELRIDAGQPTTVTIGDTPPIVTDATHAMQPNVMLRRGWQPLRIEEMATPERRLSLSVAGQPVTQWQLRPESASEGLLATYLPSEGLAIHAIDPHLNAFAVEDRFPPPDGPMVRMPFTAKWRGALRVETPGQYQFEALGTGPYVVRLDGATLLEAAPAIPEQPAQARARRDLEPGPHPIEVEFDSTKRAHTSRRMFQLYWTPPGGERHLIPPPNFLPLEGGAPSPPGRGGG